MTKEQMNIILGYLSGINTAYIALAKELAKNNAIEIESLIGNLNKTAQQLGSEVNNHQIIALALQHLSEGLEQQKEKILTPEDLNLH